MKIWLNWTFWFQIGLSSNISDYIDASILMEEGILRVNGLTESELPTNFMSTVNSIGLDFNIILKIFMKIIR